MRSWDKVDASQQPEPLSGNNCLNPRLSDSVSKSPFIIWISIQSDDIFGFYRKQIVRLPSQLQPDNTTSSTADLYLHVLMLIHCKIENEHKKSTLRMSCTRDCYIGGWEDKHIILPKFLTKTAWNWEKFGSWGVACYCATPLHPSSVIDTS